MKENFGKNLKQAMSTSLILVLCETGIRVNFYTEMHIIP